MRGLKDKVAIVAAAAPGNIGGATAFRLAQEGMKVIAADLNEAAAQAVVDEIKSAGGDAVARGFDISEEASLVTILSQVPVYRHHQRTHASKPRCRLPCDKHRDCKGLTHTSASSRALARLLH